MPAGSSPDAALRNAADFSSTPPRMQALARADFEGRVEPGSGCSFASAAGEDLLVATAGFEPANRAKGVVKIADRVHTVRAIRPGGYNALAEGLTLANDAGVSVSVRRGAGEGSREGDELVGWPADLIVVIDGDRASLSGRWTCGS